MPRKSYAHHLALCFSIRLFSAIGYCSRVADSNAAWRTSLGVMQDNGKRVVIRWGYGISTMIADDLLYYFVFA